MTMWPKHYLLVAAAGLLAATPAIAQLQRADDRPDTQPGVAPEVKLRTFGDVERPMARQRHRTEKAAYLGISTSEATPVLRRQIGLSRGVGLVVDFVAPGSPAEAAGIRALDVLKKLDDQILVNPQQLAVLVRLHQGGDEIKLELLREGKPVTATPRVTEKDVPPLEEMHWGMTEPGEDGLAEPVPSAPNAGLRPWLPMDRTMVPPGLLPDGISDKSEMQIVWDDGRTRLLITKLPPVGDRPKTVTVRDRSGRVLFEGPTDTPEQCEKIPAEVRAKLESLPRSLGLLAPPAGPATAPTTGPEGEIRN